MSAPERWHPADLELLADLVADRLAMKLGAGQTMAPELVDAAAIARRFGVTSEWVRDHSHELGVVRLGAGPRPRLRFDPERVAEALALRACGPSRRSVTEEDPMDTEVPRRRRRRRAQASAQLLPIRGDEQ